MENDRRQDDAHRGPGVSPGVFFVHSFQKEWTGKKIDKVLTLCRSLLPVRAWHCNAQLHILQHFLHTDTTKSSGEIKQL